MDIDYELTHCDSQIGRLQKTRAFLIEHRDFLSTLASPGVFFSGGELNFSNCNREDTLKVIKHFGGKWDKNYRENFVDYTRRDEVESVGLCIFGGAPPPSCRLVEEWVDVPATKVLKRRIVCQGDDAPPDEPVIEPLTFAEEAEREVLVCHGEEL